MHTQVPVSTMKAQDREAFTKLPGSLSEALTAWQSGNKARRCMREGLGFACWAPTLAPALQAASGLVFATKMASLRAARWGAIVNPSLNPNCWPCRTGWGRRSAAC